MNAWHRAKCNRSGFSMLELMMAVFILAVAATILLGTQISSTRMVGYSNNLSAIVMLTRAKMQDLEYEILEDGFSEGFADTYTGDFDDEGFPEVSYTAVVEAIEIGDDAANEFVLAINEQLYGAGEEAGSLSGNLAFSQFLPLMISYLPTIINQLGERIRRVTLTVEWTYLGREQTMTVSQYVVQLQPPDPVTGKPTDGEAPLDDPGFDDNFETPEDK